MRSKLVLLVVVLCAALTAPIMNATARSAAAAPRPEERRVRFLDFNFAGNASTAVTPARR